MQKKDKKIVTGISNYYENKLDSLKDLLGAKEVKLSRDGIIIDNKSYPIIDDVIILLNPSQYPDSIKGKVEIQSMDESVGKYAPKIQDHYGRFWNEWEGVYERYEEEFRGYFDIVDFKSLDGNRICDLGCGMGRWSYMLAQRADFKEIVLVDFSNAIFSARKIIDDDRAIFIMADLLNLPFRKNAFDFAMSLGVLHHLPKDCLDVVRDLKFFTPRLLAYLYYALDNKPFYYRILLKLYTPLRKITYHIKWEPFRVAFSWIAMILFYLPFIGLGYLLRPIGLSKYVPLFDEHHWAGIDGMRHSAYDRFFTQIEQRVSKKEIMSLHDTFEKVTVAPNQAYWHFLCESTNDED